MGILFSLYDSVGGRVLDLGKWGSVISLACGDGRLVTGAVLDRVPASVLLTVVRDWCEYASGPVHLCCDTGTELWRDCETEEPKLGLQLHTLDNPCGDSPGPGRTPDDQWVSWPRPYSQGALKVLPTSKIPQRLDCSGKCWGSPGNGLPTEGTGHLRDGSTTPRERLASGAG
jgi:hypothetical protein